MSREFTIDVHLKRDLKSPVPCIDSSHDSQTAHSNGGGVNLSPPWYTLWNKFKHTFGLPDPAVSIGPLDTSHERLYIIPIVVDDNKKGTALATIIRSKFPMGNINVVPVVKNSKGEIWAPANIYTEDQLVEVVKGALSGNSLFSAALKKAMPPPFSSLKDVFIIMPKSIIQFYNDDLSYYYSNFNGMATTVLSELINGTYANNKISLLTSFSE